MSIVQPHPQKYLSEVSNVIYSWPDAFFSKLVPVFLCRGGLFLSVLHQGHFENSLLLVSSHFIEWQLVLNTRIRENLRNSRRASAVKKKCRLAIARREIRP